MIDSKSTERLSWSLLGHAHAPIMMCLSYALSLTNNMMTACKSDCKARGWTSETTAAGTHQQRVLTHTVVALVFSACYGMQV